jgi:LemA protein
MKAGDILIGIAIIAVIAIVIIAIPIGMYNGLVSKDVEIENKWAHVETAYQRRADLLPGLVTTVKKYATHEEQTFIKVIQARSAISNAETASEMQQADGMLKEALKSLFMVVEAYPELKASEHFMALQDELAGTENRIKYERDEYNNAVRDYKTSVRSFPTNIIAGIFGFREDKWEMFESERGAENAPNIDALFNK